MMPSTRISLHGRTSKQVRLGHEEEEGKQQQQNVEKTFSLVTVTKVCFWPLRPKTDLSLSLSSPTTVSRALLLPVFRS